MSALLLAAMLTTADAGALDAAEAAHVDATAAFEVNTATVSSSKRLSVMRNATELLYIDNYGQLHLVRWCTPWDVAEAVLAGQPRAGAAAAPGNH